MCRNIKTLFNFEPPATDDEIRASALQQKVSYTTTIAGAHATLRALATLDDNVVNRLQDLHAEIKQGEAA